jgi:serine/threonine protein kinase
MNGPEPGLEILPGLTLLRRLGKGGMGEAWLARDAQRGCDVVAKLVPAGAAPAEVALLRREARLVRKLDHPRIVPVYGFRDGPSASVVTLRYMPGGDAGQLRGAPVARIVAVARDVADALDYLHRFGVVHRDVKLSNVLLDAEGRGHLADFGIASLAAGEEDGLLLRGGGSRASMSPQQRAGAPPEPADDLYALGVLLHELLAAGPESGGDGALPKLPPELPVRLRGLANALVAESPAWRPRSAAAVRDELDAVVAELRPLAPVATSPAPRLQPPPRAAEAVVTPSLFGREPQATSAGRKSGLAPWQLALLLGLGVLAAATALWLPRWATDAPVVEATPSPPPAPLPAEAPAAPSPQPEAEATPAVAAPPSPLKASADPPRRAALAEPERTPPPDPTPAPAPTPDRPAETAALARYRDDGLALESREDWKGALREYEAALTIDPRVTFALEGRERARKRAELDDAIAFHGQHPERLSAPAVAREVEQLIERARAVRPAGADLERRIAALEAELVRARTPVAVVIESDGLTELTLSRVGRLGTLTRRSLELVPGSYTLTGSRRGYRDVRRQFSVAPGAAPPPVALRCQEAL